jgi:hypothetical protein
MWGAEDRSSKGAPGKVIQGQDKRIDDYIGRDSLRFRDQDDGVPVIPWSRAGEHWTTGSLRWRFGASSQVCGLQQGSSEGAPTSLTV